MKIRTNLELNRKADPEQLVFLGLEACEYLRKICNELKEPDRTEYLDLIKRFKEDLRASSESANQLYTDLIFAIDLYLYRLGCKHPAAGTDRSYQRHK